MSVRGERLMNELGGWKDLRASLVASAKGAGTPTLAPFGPTGNINQLRFGVGDSVYLAVHWDHDVLPDTLCYPHVHWSTDGTSTNSVKWEIRLTTAAGHNQANFPAETLIAVEEAAHGTAWRHMVTEDTVGITIPEVDALTIVELKRVTNGVSDNANAVFGLFMDFHYQTGPYYGTPNRAPNFYY